MKVNRAILPDWHYALDSWTYPVPLVLVGSFLFFWTAILTNIPDSYILATILTIFFVIRLVLLIQLMTADIEVVKI